MAGAASGILEAGSARTLPCAREVGSTVWGSRGTSDVLPAGAAAAVAVGIPTLAATKASPIPAVPGRRRGRFVADFVLVSHCVISVLLCSFRSRYVTTVSGGAHVTDVTKVKLSPYWYPFARPIA